MTDPVWAGPASDLRIGDVVRVKAGAIGEQEVREWYSQQNFFVVGLHAERGAGGPYVEVWAKNCRNAESDNFRADQLERVEAGKDSANG